MTNFLLGGLYSLLNQFKLKVWPNKAILKRPRRDSVDEEEDDDVITGCETLSKRPRWMNSSHTSPTLKMSAYGFKHTPTSSTSKSLPFKVNSKKSSQKCNTGVKENSGLNTEIIDLDSESPSSVEHRSPLSDLAVRPRSKTPVPSNPQNVHASSNGTRRVDHSFNDKSRNGVRHRSYQSPSSSHQSLSRSSSNHRVTALNEMFQIEDRMEYSVLLDYYQGCPAKLSSSQTLSKWPLSSSLGMEKRMPASRSLDCIDLTKDDKQPRRLAINAKPYQPPESPDDDIKFMGEIRPVARVNSLEKKLSINELVSPQWIQEMKKKYNEKERERLRQVQEEKLKKELCARHNSARLNETLDERIRRHLTITEVVLDDTEDVEALPELTPQMMAKIKAALRPNPATEVLVEGFGQMIKRCDIQTLKNLNWLNDEVINFYMNLIIQRGQSGNYLSVYAFNTFFYPKLVSQGYNSLRRWTKKVDIFRHELILVPVHLGVHWCMAVIDFRDTTIRYYDSMGTKNDQCLNALKKYLSEESLDKKKVPYDVKGWKLENVKDIPQQMNGNDCGMFSCMFGEFLSRDAKISFSQRDIPYFRQKMVYEIITKRLLM